MDLTCYTYMKDFGNHSLTVLAGYSFQQFNSEWVSRRFLVITDGFLYNILGAGNSCQAVCRFRSFKTSLGSYFGRIKLLLSGAAIY